MQKELKIIVGYDIREPSGESQASLLERYARGEFGEPSEEFDGSPQSTADWIYLWAGEQNSKLKVIPYRGNESTLIVGVPFIALSCRQSNTSTVPRSLDALQLIVEEATRDLVRLGVTVPPAIYVQWDLI